MTLLQPGTVIPPGAHLLGNGATVIDPDVLLRAVRETMTIVRPGETLIIRLPMAMPDPVFAQYAQGVMQGLEKAGVRAVVLRADQLAVTEAPSGRPEPDQATIGRAPYEPESGE